MYEVREKDILHDVPDVFLPVPALDPIIFCLGDAYILYFIQQMPINQ
jgi:hypothetical protein